MNNSITINGTEYNEWEILNELLEENYPDESLDFDEYNYPDEKLKSIDELYKNNWDSFDKVFTLIYHYFKLKTYYTEEGEVLGLVSRAIVDDPILENLNINIFDVEVKKWRNGDLNTLFGFNFDMGRFDPMCDKFWNIDDYGIDIDEILKALKNDDCRKFSSFDNFIDWVNENKKINIAKELIHCITNDAPVLDNLINFFNLIINASAKDEINYNLEEHEALFNVYNYLKKLKK